MHLLTFMSLHLNPYVYFCLPVSAHSIPHVCQSSSHVTLGTTLSASTSSATMTLN